MFGIAVHRHQTRGNATAVNPSPAAIGTGYQQPVVQPVVQPISQPIVQQVA